MASSGDHQVNALLSIYMCVLNLYLDAHCACVYVCVDVGWRFVVTAPLYGHVTVYRYIYVKKV
jgi:hypothetical protein